MSLRSNNFTRYVTSEVYLVYLASSRLKNTAEVGRILFELPTEFFAAVWAPYECQPCRGWMSKILPAFARYLQCRSNIKWWRCGLLPWFSVFHYYCFLHSALHPVRKQPSFTSDNTGAVRVIGKLSSGSRCLVAGKKTSGDSSAEAVPQVSCNLTGQVCHMRLVWRKVSFLWWPPKICKMLEQRLVRFVCSQVSICKREAVPLIKAVENEAPGGCIGHMCNSPTMSIYICLSNLSRPKDCRWQRTLNRHVALRSQALAQLLSPEELDVQSPQHRNELKRLKWLKTFSSLSQASLWDQAWYKIGETAAVAPSLS